MIIRKGITVIIDGMLLTKEVFVSKNFILWITVNLFQKISRNDKTIVKRVSRPSERFISFPWVLVFLVASPKKEDYFLRDTNCSIAILCHVDCVSNM